MVYIKLFKTGFQSCQKLYCIVYQRLPKYSYNVQQTISRYAVQKP